jgi:hypothetical protein
LPPAIPPAWRSPHWALPLDGAMVIFLQIPANSTSPFSEISYEQIKRRTPLQRGKKLAGTRSGES